MKLLVDNQLPAALARYLDGNGFEARHVLDVGLDTATDRQIWEYVAVQGFALVSKDEDFFHLAVPDPSGPPLVWVRLENGRKQTLLASFETILPRLRQELQAGQRVIELR